MTPEVITIPQNGISTLVRAILIEICIGGDTIQFDKPRHAAIDGRLRIEADPFRLEIRRTGVTGFYVEIEGPLPVQTSNSGAINNITTASEIANLF